MLRGEFRCRSRQRGGEFRIDLDGDDLRARLEEPERERPEPRPDLHHRLTRFHPAGPRDFAHGTRIDDEVLPEHFRGPEIEPAREVADVGGAEEAWGQEQTSVTLPAALRDPRPARRCGPPGRG